MPMRTLRGRTLALLGLIAYAMGGLALPSLHLVHHDVAHSHGDGATIVLLEGSIGGSLDATPASAVRPLADEHGAFDADLAALDLLDAGHFGVAVVDCELAGYTLALCDDRTAPSHGFGDELIARTPHHDHRHAPLDPTHGRGSLLHFGLAFLTPPPVLVPPPPLLAGPVPPLPVAERVGFSIHAPLRARAPPVIHST
jgi:hypothetical protein